jgi:hypothetical protein
MIACRIVAQLMIHRFCQQRLTRSSKALLEWSFHGGRRHLDNDDGEQHGGGNRRLTRYTIHLGMESLLRRNLLNALSIYMQNQGVESYNVGRYLDHYIKDVGRVLSLDLSRVDQFGYYYITMDHLQRNSFLFGWVTIAIVFAVMGGLQTLTRTSSVRPWQAEADVFVMF